MFYCYLVDHSSHHYQMFEIKFSSWVDLDDEIPELDLRQISHEYTAWMCDLAEIQWSDFMNQDPLIHWVLFLSCDIFRNIFPLKLLIFIWNTTNYFLIVKVVVASSQQEKYSVSLPHDVRVNNHCDVTMSRWHCLGNYVTSQWIRDVVIDTKQSCD